MINKPPPLRGFLIGIRHIKALERSGYQSWVYITQDTMGDIAYEIPHAKCNTGSCHQCLSLRVQVPNNHILTQNLYYNLFCPTPKYLIIGYLDPLGMC